MLAYGQVTIGDFKPLDQFPPYAALMEALADIMERAQLLKEEAIVSGAPSSSSCEAGKVIDYRM